MTTRCKLVVGLALAASGLASTKLKPAHAVEEPPKMGEFLFVRSAKA